MRERPSVPGYGHALFIGVTARRLFAGLPAPHVDTPIEELEAEYQRTEPVRAAPTPAPSAPPPTEVPFEAAEPVERDDPRAEVGSFEPPPPLPPPPPPPTRRAPPKRAPARPKATAPAQPDLFTATRKS